MTIYKTSCGCELFKEELITTKKNGLSPRKRCSEHLGHVIGRINQCVDCGEYISFGATGPIRIRCKKCYDENHAKDCRERYRPEAKKRKKKKLKPKKKILGPVRVWSVEDAVKKGVPCIPLQKLFERRSSL